MPGPKPRPGIMDIAAYVGGEASAPNATRLIRLASNEGALGPSAQAMAAHREAAASLHRYPDGACAMLCEAIAAKEGLNASRIVCGSGSDELIALLVRGYVGPGENIVHSEHAFLMYGLNAKAVGAFARVAPAVALGHDVDALAGAVNENTRAVFVANPNNPTGTLLNTQELARLRAAVPDDVLLVIDSAYAEYIDSPEYSTGSELVDRFDNVVMLRTFSKLYGLGGIRLGWAYCPEAVADVLHRIRGPFNVSAPAQAAGIAALADGDHVAQSLENNATTLPWFSARLNAMGLATSPSFGNFVLPQFSSEHGLDAEAARLHLKSEGILVRQVGAYGLPEHLRISIGTRDEMERVAEVLEAWVNSNRRD